MREPVELIRKHLAAEQERIGLGAKNAVTEHLSKMLVEACAAQAKENVAPIVEAEQAYDTAPRKIHYTLGGEKLHTQAEVDALIAAAVALVVQKAAEHCPFWIADEHLGHVECTCGWSGLHAAEKSWPAHILTLADQNALAEHDAALREALKLQTEVFREQKAKLKAENAGLHSRLDELCTKAVIHMEKANRFTYDDLLKAVTEARALLGEKP